MQQIQLPFKMFSESFLFYLFYVDSLTELLFGGAGGGKTVHSAIKDILRLVGKPRLEKCNGKPLTPEDVYKIITGKKVRFKYRWVQDEPKNILVLRQTYNTIQDSYYTDLKKAIAMLGFEDYFETKTSPLYIKYLPNDKVALFRGLDNVEKLKGITCPNGGIDHYTVEEITETGENSSNQLAFRTRGGGDYIDRDNRKEMFKKLDSANTYDELMSDDVKEDIYQLLGYNDLEDFEEQKKTNSVLFNPVNKGHWVHERFFLDSKGKEFFHISDGMFHTDKLFIHHSTHRDNPFLTLEDHRRYMAYKYINQYFYNVYCLGLWGVLGDLIFTKVKPARFSDEFIREIPQQYIGLDFGSVDPNAIMRLGVNEDKKEIYVLDEMVQNKLDTQQLVDMVKGFIDPHETVWCDSAGLQQITDLKTFDVDARSVSKYGGANFKPHGIGVLWGYTIYFSEHCKNFAREISQYSWQEDSKGNKLNKPQDGNDHTIDAGLFYALNSVLIRKKASRVYGG